MTKNLLITTILVVLFSCGKKESVEISTNLSSYNDKNMKFGETLTIQLNTEQKIDSFYILYNDKKYHSNQLKLDSINSKLGYNSISYKAYYGGNEYSEDAFVTILSPNKEIDYSYTLVKTYPHDATSFTEGFFIHNGLVYESAGLQEKSRLFTYELSSGKVHKNTAQAAEIFSEGIAILKDTLYQLTYQNRKVLVYNSKDLSGINTLEMPSFMKEGWGATTMNNQLVFSDGTQTLFFVDSNMNVQKTVQVVGHEKVYTYVNELEYFNGKIYANVWQQDFILIINPNNGVVEGIIDVTEIAKNEKTSQEAVLNGIAVINGNLLITGKYWKNSYEIQIRK